MEVAIIILLADLHMYMCGGDEVKQLEVNKHSVPFRSFKIFHKGLRDVPIRAAQELAFARNSTLRRSSTMHRHTALTRNWMNMRVSRRFSPL